MSEKKTKPSEWEAIRRKNREENDRRNELLLKEQRLLDAKPEIESIMEWFYDPKDLQDYLNIYPNNSRISEAIGVMGIEEPYKNILADKQNHASAFILRKYQVDVLGDFAREMEEQEKREQEIENHKNSMQLEEQPDEQNKAFTLRQKVLTLMLLTFGKLESPEGVIQERIVEFFYKFTHGDISNLRRFIAKPTTHEPENKSSIRYLIEDLNYVRNDLEKLGLTETGISAIKAEIDSLITDLKEEEN